MNRTSGFYVVSTTLGESVNAFVPYALPPKNLALVASEFYELNRQAEIALARLAGVSNMVPSV
ncbi:MAG: Fic family protein, partial [Burkholderiaceae bacterium]|nr:Fic family protein [Burkholderiaceae bacterium]